MANFEKVYATVKIEVTSHKELAGLVSPENLKAFLQQRLGKDAKVLDVQIGRQTFE